MLKQKIIVFGHEKGGTGKSTLTIHVAIGLKMQNYTVGVIDLDARQGTSIRFLTRRERLDLMVPDQYFGILNSTSDSKEIAFKEDEIALKTAITKMRDLDYIIIDTRGSNNNFTQLAINFCDKLITPINDSVLDIDMLISIGSKDQVFFGPYTQTVWEQKKQRNLQNNMKPIDWYLIRNRVSPIVTKNTNNCTAMLETICRKIGCKLGPSITERVIYKETLDRGLLLFDLQDQASISNFQTFSKAYEDISRLVEFVKQ